MIIRHLFSEALNALNHYRMRSILTMLSITWGVAALVLLLAYGQGFERALIKAFLQIGKDLVVLFPGQTSMQAGGERSGRRIRLELSDVKAIQEGVPTVEKVSPEARRYYPFNFNERVRSYSVAGVYACYEQIREEVVASGRFLSEEDVQHRRRVVVIGDNLRKELFSGIPAVDSDLKINGVRFTVVGVLEKKTQISNQFRDRVVSDVRTALARAHNFNVQDTRAVNIMEWNKFLSLITSMSTGLNILLMVIGSLTLSIGAIGVVNIMLVSVTERTREIGVLKALGARRAHILLQILLEGLVLTLTGGLFGFLLAWAAVSVVGSLPFLGALFEDTSGRGDIQLSVSTSALFISSSILIAVGLLAAMIPAWRASRLDPVQALRSE